MTKTKQVRMRENAPFPSICLLQRQRLAGTCRNKINIKLRLNMYKQCQNLRIKIKTKVEVKAKLELS